MDLNKHSIISTYKVIKGQKPLFSATNWTLLDNLNKSVKVRTRSPWLINERRDCVATSKNDCPNSKHVYYIQHYFY